MLSEMIKKFPLYFAFLTCFCSCLSNIESVQYSIDIRNAIDSSPDGYFCNIEHVSFTSTISTDPLVVDIQRLSAIEDGFIVSDTKQNIYFFDNQGHLISRFNHYGNGHGEYLNISDIYAIKGDRVEILDVNKGRIFVYDRHGSFLLEKKLEFSPSHYYHLGESYFFAHAPSSDIKDYSYSLIITDSELNVVSKHFPYKESRSVILGPRNNFYTASDSLVFSPTYSNRYYTICEGSAQKRFYLDYGRNSLRKEVLMYPDNNPLRYLNHLAESGCVYFENVHETSSHIYVDYQCYNSSYVTLIDKTSGKIKTFRFKDKKVCSSQYLPLATKNGKFVSVLESTHDNEPTSLLLFSIKQL